MQVSVQTLLKRLQTLWELPNYRLRSQPLFMFSKIRPGKKPTWYIVATQDHAIPPGLERKMDKRTGGKVFEIVSSHVIYMSHPEEVAKIIESAAAVAIVN